MGNFESWIGDYSGSSFVLKRVHSRETYRGAVFSCASKQGCRRSWTPEFLFFCGEGFVNIQKKGCCWTELGF